MDAEGSLDSEDSCEETEVLKSNDELLFTGQIKAEPLQELLDIEEEKTNETISDFSEFEYLPLRVEIREGHTDRLVEIGEINPTSNSALGKSKVSKIIKNNKTSDKPKKCDSSSLKVNKKKHREKKTTFSCPVCNIVSPTRAASISHRNEAHLRASDGLYACNRCDKACKEYHNLLSHLKVHQKPEKIDKEKNEIKTFYNNSFVCDQCGKKYTSNKSLKVHMSAVHRIDDGVFALEMKKKSFMCFICGRCFSHYEKMNNHMSMHLQTEPHCLICEKVFASARNLKKHMMTHTGMKPYVCEICGRGFTQKTVYVDHRWSHTGEKPYECDVCKQRFPQKELVRKHLRNHTNYRPHMCDVCGRCFKRKAHVDRHRMIHFAEFPYMCTCCGKKFRQSTECINHEKKHHSCEGSSGGHVKANIVNSGNDNNSDVNVKYDKSNVSIVENDSGINNVKCDNDINNVKSGNDVNNVKYGNDVNNVKCVNDTNNVKNNDNGVHNVKGDSDVNNVKCGNDVNSVKCFNDTNNVENDNKNVNNVKCDDVNVFEEYF